MRPSIHSESISSLLEENLLEYVEDNDEYDSELIVLDVNPIYKRLTTHYGLDERLIRHVIEHLVLLSYDNPYNLNYDYIHYQGVISDIIEEIRFDNDFTLSNEDEQLKIKNVLTDKTLLHRIIIDVMSRAQTVVKAILPYKWLDDARLVILVIKGGHKK